MRIQVRNGIIIVTILCAIVISGIILFQSFLTEKQITTDSLESMQLNPPQDYIQKLTGIIQTNQNSSIRERAVFTLTDIALRKNETGKITGFLREIAINEKDTNVQSAAFSTIYLIRTVHPEEPGATMDITIDGPIQKGAIITLNANISIEKPAVKAIVGLTQISHSVEMQSEPVVLANPSERTQIIPFKIKLLSTGSFYLPVTLKVSYNRVDEDMITKRILVQVNETSGSYKILS